MPTAFGAFWRYSVAFRFSATVVPGESWKAKTLPAKAISMRAASFGTLICSRAIFAFESRVAYALTAIANAMLGAVALTLYGMLAMRPTEAVVAITYGTAGSICMTNASLHACFRALNIAFWSRISSVAVAYTKSRVAYPVVRTIRRSCAFIALLAANFLTGLAIEPLIADADTVESNATPITFCILNTPTLVGTIVWANEFLSTVFSNMFGITNVRTRCLVASPVPRAVQRAK